MSALCTVAGCTEPRWPGERECLRHNVAAYLRRELATINPPPPPSPEWDRHERMAQRYGDEYSDNAGREISPTTGRRNG